MRALQVMVAQLAFLSVAIHAVVVAPRLRAVFVSGVFPRLATVLLVLAIAGTVAGVVAFRYDLAPRRLVYWFGVALMLGQVVGWLVYHNLDLLGFGHSHGNVLWSVLAHFEADAVEGAAKLAEALAAVGLLVLLRVDPRARTDATGRGDDAEASA